MRNKITTEELIMKRFSKDEAARIFEEIDSEVQKIKWGGRRKGAGRKPKGKVLQFIRRLSAAENQLIDDIRNNIISIENINKLKQC